MAMKLDHQGSPSATVSLNKLFVPFFPPLLWNPSNLDICLSDGNQWLS